MGQTIDWLDNNQGFALALLTLVYVVTTIIMAYLMMRSNRLTRDLEEQRSRPAVVFNIVSEHHAVHAVLKNIGLTPAYSVQVACEPKITGVGGKGNQIAVTRYPVSFLPPRDTLTDFIDSGPGFFQRYSEPVFKGTVKYTDALGKVYAESFTIDLTVSRERISLIQPDIAEELEKIRKTLEQIATRLRG